MALCNITGLVYLPNGELARSRQFVFRRNNRSIVAEYLGTVLPTDVAAQTNSAGQISVSLLTGSYTVFSGDFFARSTVPDELTAEFSDIIGASSIPDAPPVWYSQALAARDEAVAAAEDAADSAAGAATAGATAGAAAAAPFAEAASDSADLASGFADDALAARNAAIAAAEDASDIVSTVPPSFTTRADALAALVPAAVESFTIADGGLSFFRLSPGTPNPAITLLDGSIWGPSGVVRAGHFGFDAANGTADQNRDAIVSAITWAGGEKVFVDVPVDWQCGYLVTNSMHINVEFNGAGKKQGGIWNVQNAYENIQNVSSLTNVSLSLQGMNTRAVAIVVPNAALYVRGDVMRIVSDDINLFARDGYTARWGEDFIIGHINNTTNTVYAMGRLEFFDRYVTNIRIGRMPKYEINIQGLIVQGTTGATARMLTVGPFYRPKVSAKFVDASYNSLGTLGCIEGIFDVQASFALTGSYDTLTYGVNEMQGSRNKYFNFDVTGARHAFTTGYGSVEENSPNLERYGPPRDNTVINGDADNCTNSPWDDHEGAVRSTFINCSSRNPHRGGGVSFTAFQARGQDMQILDCNTGDGFSAILMNHRKSTGVHVIRGGTHRCPVVIVSDDASTPYAGVRVVSPDVIVRGDVVIFNVQNFNLHIEGGRYEHRLSGSSERALTQVKGRVMLSGNPIFLTDGAGSSYRFANMSEGAWFTGEFTYMRRHTGFVNGMFTTSDTAAVAVTINQVEGARPSILTVSGAGVFTNGQWTHNDDTGTARIVTQS